MYFLSSLVEIEPCYEGDSLPCPRHSRCLTHSVTGDNFCLESCYIDNGGCSDDEICYYERADENCNPRLEPCFKTACADIPGLIVHLFLPIFKAQWVLYAVVLLCVPSVCPFLAMLSLSTHPAVLYAHDCHNPTEGYTLRWVAVCISYRFSGYLPYWLGTQ